MIRFAHPLAALVVASFLAPAALGQTAALDAPDRFAFGGPEDGVYRLYDRATGKLIARTDVPLAQVYTLPGPGGATYVVLSEGAEDSWAFGVWKAKGAGVSRLFGVSGVARGFEIHDLNSDGELDFPFHISEGETFEATFGLVAQRDYVSGRAGYREEIPACASARNAAARQRLAYAIDLNNRLSSPIPRALGILQPEMTRITQNCPAG